MVHILAYSNGTPITPADLAGRRVVVCSPGGPAATSLMDLLPCAGSRIVDAASARLFLDSILVRGHMPDEFVVRVDGTGHVPDGLNSPELLEGTPPVAQVWMVRAGPYPGSGLGPGNYGLVSQPGQEFLLLRWD